MNNKKLSIILIIALIFTHSFHGSDGQKSEQPTLKQRAALLLANIHEADGHETENNSIVVTNETVDRELGLLADECDFLVSCAAFNSLSRKDIRELTELRRHGGDWKSNPEKKPR